MSFSEKRDKIINILNDILDTEEKNISMDGFVILVDIRNTLIERF